MAELAISTIFYILLIIFDFIPVIKSKKKIPISIYAFCLISTYIVLVIQRLDIFDLRAYSPAIPIRELITAIFHVK